MKASELKFPGLECIRPSEPEISGGYTSDLLSDVMANLKEGDALITIQAHKNTIAVAALMGASAVIFCHGRVVSPDVLEAAAKENISVFVSTGNQFNTTCAFAKALGE
ncbi:MAG: iron-sulfur binding hydrogenase [Verrucomicrobia bacterium]|nr:iron-sulfur binding hydrogenase [Verrucomicrobiota bacterium]